MTRIINNAEHIEAAYVSRCLQDLCALHKFEEAITTVGDLNGELVIFLDGKPHKNSRTYRICIHAIRPT